MQSAAQPGISLNGCFSAAVEWIPSIDSAFVWQASAGNDFWQVRVNDFPDEPLYTLYVDGGQVGDFDDWPATWRRPR